MHVETGEELDARLTPAQRQQFDAAKKAQLAKQYAEASAGFKALLQDLPGDSLLTKWSSDAAIEMGDSAYAVGVLKPLVLANLRTGRQSRCWRGLRPSQATYRLVMPL